MATATRHIRTIKIISGRRFFPRMASSSMAFLVCSLFQQQNEVVKTYPTAQQIKTNWPLCILGFCIRALKWRICRETCPWGHNKFKAGGLLVFLGKNTVTIYSGSPFTKKTEKTQGLVSKVGTAVKNKDLVLGFCFSHNRQREKLRFWALVLSSNEGLTLKTSASLSKWSLFKRSQLRLKSPLPAFAMVQGASTLLRAHCYNPTNNNKLHLHDYNGDTINISWFVT